MKDMYKKLKLSALGKVIPEPELRKKILIRGSHFNTLLRLLQQTDWSQTPVYHQFLRNGRWKHEDTSVYSEIELQYNLSYINKLINNENVDELTKNEMCDTIKEYTVKTMHTLEVLMNQCNMMYYFEKIATKYGGIELNLDQLEKLMSRCLKQYTLIDSFINIFKLIHKKEVSPFGVCNPTAEDRPEGPARREHQRAGEGGHQRTAQGEPHYQHFQLQGEDQLELKRYADLI